MTLVRDDVVGRDVVRVLKTQGEVYESMYFCDVFVSLDNGKVIRCGWHSEVDPVVLHDSQVHGELTVIPDNYDVCRQTIAEVYETIPGHHIVFALNDGNAFWVDEEEYGTELHVDSIEVFHETTLRTWAW